MPRSFKHAVWSLCLVTLALPAAVIAEGNWQGPVAAAGTQTVGPQVLTRRSSGQMRVGLTLVAVDTPASAPLPDPAGLGYPASPSAVLCRSEGDGYRECRTPFRGRVLLSREVADTRCVENGNWGWRDGAVWVDRGCAAVFVQAAAAFGEAPPAA